MKTAGIITVHCADNLGAVLQAAAMQQALQDIGCEAGVIDYRPRAIRRDYRIFFSMKELRQGMKYGLKAVWRSIIWVRIRNMFRALRKKRSFERFRREHIRFVAESGQDILVTGSDQLWNPDITGGFDPKYFLCDAAPDQRCVAYGVSTGRAYDDKEKEAFAGLTRRLDFISIREEEQRAVLEQITGKKIACVLDPTLLQDRGYWAKMEEACKAPEHYILYYSLTPSQEEIDFVNGLAERRNCQVIHFFYGRLRKRIQRDYRDFYYDGPGEFLYLVDHADYVVTDSFHGTVFSILFGKQFYTFLPPGRGGRAANLLKKLELEDRIVSQEQAAGEDESWNQDRVRRLLEREREKSWEYLETSIRPEWERLYYMQSDT